MQEKIWLVILFDKITRIKLAASLKVEFFKFFRQLLKEHVKVIGSMACVHPNKRVRHIQNMAQNQKQFTENQLDSRPFEVVL